MSSAASADLHTAISRADAVVAGLTDELVRVRRHLHQNPEPSWAEHQTQAFVAAWLRERGVETKSTAGTGLYTDLGPAQGPAVFYRADMDALPMADLKDPAHAPWASRRPGLCHACGHDAHTTIGLAVAAAVHASAELLPMRVRCVYQPAEEVSPSGAERVATEGVLRDGVAAFAVHVDPMRDIGTVGLREGVLTSATDTFSIEIEGRTGHSARPWLANDALLAACEITLALQRVVAQKVNPLRTALVHVGRFESGDAPNVIAGIAHLKGVTRCFEPDVREILEREVRNCAQQVAIAFGCQARVIWEAGAPPVRNNGALHDIVAGAARDVLGAAGLVTLPEPSTGSEDFGVFGSHMPIFMTRLGVHTPGQPSRHLHTNLFDIDERALAYGARIMARAVLTRAFANPTPPDSDHFTP